MKDSGMIHRFIVSMLFVLVLSEVITSYSLSPPRAFAQLRDQDLPVTGRAVYFRHAVNPGQSYSVPAEGGPYIRVKVRLAEGVLAGEWAIDILDTSGSAVQQISSELLKDGTWTCQVFGPGLTVRVPTNGGRIIIEERLLLVTQLPIQNAIPSNSHPNFRPAVSYEEPNIRETSRSVVHLRMIHGKVEKPCTGFLLSPTLVMTNQHCIPTADIARTVCVHVAYDSAPLRDALQVVELVTSDEALDYSVIRLRTPPSSEIKPVRWRISGPNCNERVVIIQHPNGQPMQVADDDDCYVSAVRTQGRNEKLVDFGHRCDTMDGSSGSIVLGVKDLRVVGIHHWGIRPGKEYDPNEQNQGVRIDEIFNQLKQRACSETGAREVYDAVTPPQENRKIVGK